MENVELDMLKQALKEKAELLAVLEDAASLIPVAPRMHPADIFALQSRVVAAILKAKGEAA